jgi:hypothetical protein
METHLLTAVADPDRVAELDRLGDQIADLRSPRRRHRSTA